jgi:hypothetical protein
MFAYVNLCLQDQNLLCVCVCLVFVCKFIGRATICIHSNDNQESPKVTRLGGSVKIQQQFSGPSELSLLLRRSVTPQFQAKTEFEDCMEELMVPSYLLDEYLVVLADEQKVACADTETPEASIP